jgi:hypothetical protein
VSQIENFDPQGGSYLQTHRSPKAALSAGAERIEALSIWPAMGTMYMYIYNSKCVFFLEHIRDNFP